MNWKTRVVVSAFLAIFSVSALITPARADKDVKRAIRRAIRQEQRDRLGDTIREAICRDADSERRRRECRRARRRDRIGDEIRRGVNRGRILREIFDDD